MRDTLQSLAIAFTQLGSRLGRRLGSPAAQQRLRALLIALLLAWIAVSLARLLWSLWPVPATPLAPVGAVLNLQPASVDARAQRTVVDVTRLAEQHLFGAPQAEPSPAVSAQDDAAQARARLAGIEDGARETRLALRLNGVVSSTEAGYGFAMIEHQSVQALYAVGDRLPVGAAVTLAKVLPGRVVIDNAGTYELLTLFEPHSVLGTAASAPVRAVAAARRSSPAPAPVPARTEQVASSGLAAQYRERLYSNPQSLAEAVRVSAVRENGQLIGYRLSPGSAAADFASLGLEPGDVVTAVNGLPLSDPANTVRLYQTMRTATEAVFDLRRGAENLSLSVRLPAAGETP